MSPISHLALKAGPLTCNAKLVWTALNILVDSLANVHSAHLNKRFHEMVHFYPGIQQIKPENREFQNIEIL